MQSRDKAVGSSIIFTPAQARGFVVDWLDAWNSHDLGRIMSHYADGVRFTANTVVRRWGRPDGLLKGKVELRRQFATGLGLAPKLHFTLMEIFTAPSGYAVLYRRENGNTAIDSVRLDKEGRAIEVTAYYAAAQP